MKKNILLTVILLLISSNLIEARGGHGGGPSGGGGDAGPTIPPHFVKRMSQIKDVIIKILSAKRSDDLLTVEGKERLKDELLEGINEAVGLEEPPVTGVFFTEFMIQ